MPDEPAHTPSHYADPAPMARLLRSKDKYKAQAEQATAALATAQRQLTERDAELTTARAQLAGSTNTALAKENLELKTQIRTRVHRDKFNEVAARLKARPEALDDLWGAIKLDLSGEVPDEAAMEAAISTEATGKRGYMFGEGKPTEPIIPPAPVPGRGAADTNGGAPIINEDQLNDPVWTMKNWDSVVQASKANTIK